MSNSSLVITCDGVTHSSSASTVAIALCYVVLIPLIVLGNGLVVASFIINQRLRTATNIFICGLGFSDLLIGVFSVPYWTYISSLSSLMEAFCTPLYTVYICVDIGTGCASILQLTSIAIERLYFTVAPLKHRRLPRSVYWYMLAVAWIFSVFAASLQPLQDKAKWHGEYSIFLMVTCFIIPLIIIIIVYLYILKVGRIQAKRTASTQSRMGSTGAGYIKEFNIFVTVIVITGVFAIAWAPFFITTVVATFCSTCLARPQSDHLVRFVKWMQYSSSAINPYIYAYRNEEVRNSFKKILRNLFCFCCKEDVFNTGTLPRRQTYENNNAYSFSKDDVFDQSNPHDSRFPRSLDVNGFSCNEQSSRENTDEKQEARNLKPTAHGKGQEHCYGKSNESFTHPRLEPQLAKPKHFEKNQEIAPREREHFRKTHNEKDTNHGINRAKRTHSKSTLEQSQHENKRQSDDRRFQRKLYENEQRVAQKGIMHDQSQEKRLRSQSMLDPRSVNNNKRDFAHEKTPYNTRQQRQRNFDNKEIKNERQERRRRKRSYSNRDKRETRPRSVEKTYSFQHSIACYENPVDLASDGTYV